MNINLRLTEFSHSRTRAACKAALLFCLALAMSHCASAKSGFQSIRSQSQTSIYSVQEASNPDLKPSRNIIQEDFQSTLQNQLSGSTFDQRLWGRDCDCL